MSQKQWMKVRTTGSDAPIHSRDISCEATGCRPVVVIDPEDREQVQRLVGLATDHPAEVWVDAFHRALREFADPTPRPDEPTGLGAVVEAEFRDDEGRGFGPAHWAKAGDGTWLCLTDGLTKTAASWPFLSSVRVLSEGVTV